MAAQLRAEQTIATPTPLMQVRFGVPCLPAYQSQGLGPSEVQQARWDRRIRRRREVLRQVETRLRAIRQEVDEEQRQDTNRSTSTGYHTRAPMSSRETIPDVLGDSTMRGVATQTASVFVVEDSEPSVIENGSEGEEDECVMEQSMEQSMEAQHPVDDRLMPHPPVFDELYTDTLEPGRLVNDNRRERSKSLPPTWD